MIREEIEVHERDVMETDRTGIITLVFSTATEANAAARERFLNSCSDWGKDFDEKEEENDEECMLNDSSLADQGVRISRKKSAAGEDLHTYSYTFADDDVEDEGERVVDRSISFEVLAIPCS